MGWKSDKECAQKAVAAAAAGGSQEVTQTLIERNLSTDEIERAKAYLESGKSITGPS